MSHSLPGSISSGDKTNTLPWIRLERVLRDIANVAGFGGDAIEGQRRVFNALGQTMRAGRLPACFCAGGHMLYCARRSAYPASEVTK